MLITIEEAAKKLLKGEVIAVPTETVYGLAGALSHENAIEKIFALKGRPPSNPLIIHVASIEGVFPFVKEFPAGFADLAKAFWPGPLTLILPVNELAVPKKARAGLPTAGFRIPGDPVAHSLLKLTGPLVMPSANLSGKPSATALGHIERDFGKDFPALAGGGSCQGLESTIAISIDGIWHIIRLGAIPREAFVSIIGYMPELSIAPKGEKPLCPGQMFRHYAPKAILNLVKIVPTDMQGAIVGFSDRKYPSNVHLFSLGSSKAPEEVAANLYNILRKLDDCAVEQAYVDCDFPNDGLWVTIAERLCRAAQQ